MLLSSYFPQTEEEQQQMLATVSLDRFSCASMRCPFFFFSDNGVHLGQKRGEGRREAGFRPMRMWYFFFGETSERREGGIEGGSGA